MRASMFAIAIAFAFAQLTSACGGEHCVDDRVYGEQVDGSLRVAAGELEFVQVTGAAGDATFAAHDWSLVVPLPPAAGTYDLATLGVTLCEGESTKGCVALAGTIAYRPDFSHLDVVFDADIVSTAAPSEGMLHVRAFPYGVETCGSSGPFGDQPFGLN